MIKKQSTLFPKNEMPVLVELDLKAAENLAEQVKAALKVQCQMIEVAGSIRRQKTKVHDIDFVILAKSDAEWSKINQELKRLKAKPNCSGNAVIKAFVPYQGGLFQVDFYRAKPSTFGIHLLIRTGSADHNMWLASCAFSKGMRLRYSEGLIKNGAIIAGKDEKSVFEALGLPCPLPSERETLNGKPVWIQPKK
jgi:DNA polymerase (family X)